MTGVAKFSAGVRAGQVLGVTFLALFAAAGLRSAPGVIMVPLEVYFGWERSTVSNTAAVGILLYGLVGPFAAALMLRFGIRRTMLAGLGLMSLATFASLGMSRPWHYLLTWGILSGIGSGAVAPVLGAAVVNRWFAARQGFAMGLLTASTATGSLVLLPFFAWLSQGGAWRPVALWVSLGCLVVVPLVWLLVPERPVDVGVSRYGEREGCPPPTLLDRATPPGLALTVLAQAVRRPVFWLLFGTFFVCGLTTNGLIGTHLIAFCGDHGIAPVAAAGLLSTMGLFDLFGTTASGWFTDRYEPRYLLCGYYGLRGLSLIALPFLGFTTAGLLGFAMLYGLDWVATVPPTVQLTNRCFGEREAPIVFGWVMVGHQLGAATAAAGAGAIREATGSYLPAFVFAGGCGLVAAVAVLWTRSGLQSG